MENVLETLIKKAERHESKIKTHKLIEKNLRLEYKALNEGRRKNVVGNQLEITIRSIEYHKGSAKTYRKSANLIREHYFEK